MAQNFANGDSHFGIDPNSPDTQMGAFVAQIHGDDAADAIISESYTCGNTPLRLR